jgi:hypothetical protein
MTEGRDNFMGYLTSAVGVDAIICQLPESRAGSTGRCNTTSESEVLLKQEVLGFSGFLQNKS